MQEKMSLKELFSACFNSVVTCDMSSIVLYKYSPAMSYQYWVSLHTGFMFKIMMNKGPQSLK